MFTKAERSSFSYWFAHWCAFNLTALNLKCWKFRFLFHDIEKPWLKLILRDYSKVQKIHRTNNKHHLTYKNPNKIDWVGLVVDWECSRLTKAEAQMNALETYQYFIDVRYKEGTLSEELANLLKSNVPPLLKKFRLI